MNKLFWAAFVCTKLSIKIVDVKWAWNRKICQQNFLFIALVTCSKLKSFQLKFVARYLVVIDEFLSYNPLNFSFSASFEIFCLNFFSFVMSGFELLKSTRYKNDREFEKKIRETFIFHRTDPFQLQTLQSFIFHHSSFRKV